MRAGQATRMDLDQGCDVGVAQTWRRAGLSALDRGIVLRIPAKPLMRYPWYLRPFFWSQRRRYGEVLLPALLWARVPRLFLTIAAVYATLDRPSSPLDAALRTLVTVRVSQLNQCRFCLDLNSALLARRSGSMEKLAALQEWRASDQFSPLEQAALDYAEAVTDTARRVEERMLMRLRQFFTEDAIIELTALIAFQNLSSKFNSALDVPSQGFCPMSLSGGHDATARPI